MFEYTTQVVRRGTNRRKRKLRQGTLPYLKSCTLTLITR
jgi:hypothetical protein